MPKPPPSDPSQPKPIQPPSPIRHNRWTLLESIVLFLAAALLMLYIQPGGYEPPDPRADQAASRPARRPQPQPPEPGLAGHDSFYHLKMAALIPQIGLVDRFPWLRYCYFRNQGDAFVNHHVGFQILLVPFVTFSRYLIDDEIAGARLAVCTFFGAAFAILNLILIHCGVRWRWLWWLLFLLLPDQFFTRQAFLRAISPALLLMLLILWLMFKNRPVWTGLAIALFIHIYLGAVTYAPLLVIAYAAACFIAPREDRSFPTRMVVAGLIGWTLGIITHPYAGGMFEFLRLQVFGTGLSPHIAVGNEWKPYSGVWFFVTSLAGILLTAWTAALVLRLRFGPRLDAREMTLLLLHFGFLLLTLKARRFIEYWPVFCLLSAATLSSPIVRRLPDWLDRSTGESSDESNSSLALLFVLVSAAWATALLILALRLESARSIAVAWPLITAVGICAAFGLLRAWLTAPPRIGLRALRTLLVAIAVVFSVSTAAAFAGGKFADVRRRSECDYDLKALREVAAYLKQHSNPGDLVFTDDWDDFGAFFYFNDHNHYVVGLDPEFMNARRPDLWQRFVNITRAQVPADPTYDVPDGKGGFTPHTLHVELSDLRDVFDAQFILVARDHRPLAEKLAAAPQLAELVYPSTDIRKARRNPYMIFRVLPLPEAPAATTP